MIQDKNARWIGIIVTTTVYSWVWNIWWDRRKDVSLYLTNAIPQLHSDNLRHYCKLGQPSNLAFIQSKHVEERQEEWYLGGENSGYLMLGVTTPQDSVSCFWFVFLLRTGENSSASSLLSCILSCFGPYKHVFVFFLSHLSEVSGGSLIFIIIIKKTVVKQLGLRTVCSQWTRLLCIYSVVNNVIFKWINKKAPSHNVKKLQIHGGQRQTFAILRFSEVAGMNPAVLLPDSGTQPKTFGQSASIMVQHSPSQICVRFSACCQLPIQGEKFRICEIPDPDTNISKESQENICLPFCQCYTFTQTANTCAVHWEKSCLLTAGQSPWLLMPLWKSYRKGAHWTILHDTVCTLQYCPK